tara:strand:- start:98 stop:214 length:117 start_codon:yes stop_codon:yes gene_type:complete
MRKLFFVLPIATIIACGDKDTDTGDTAVEDTEESTKGE